nr:MAG: hypothetical protein [Owegonang virus 33]
MIGAYIPLCRLPFDLFGILEKGMKMVLFILMSLSCYYILNYLVAWSELSKLLQGIFLL